jgi:hypothetical protein
MDSPFTIALVAALPGLLLAALSIWSYNRARTKEQAATNQSRAGAEQTWQTLYNELRALYAVELQGADELRLSVRQLRVRVEEYEADIMKMKAEMLDMRAELTKRDEIIDALRDQVRALRQAHAD